MVEEKAEVKEYTLVQVPTQHTIAIQTPEGEVMTTEQGIVDILNKMDKIIKAVA
jgi:hypothetical protein